jgi:putative transposase
MRTKRPYLPGVVFHITTRAHCREPYFEDPALRDFIVNVIARALRKTDAQLIAHTIMQNHYHLVVHHGVAPLAQLLQPINREVALAVQRKFQRRGYVFERRFRAKPCVDAAQLREMIVYTHLNAVRAKHCGSPEDWAWSSHCAYAGLPQIERCAQPRVRVVQELFLDHPKGSGSEAYARYVQWRRQCDDLPEDAIRPAPPRTRFGDGLFYEYFTPAPNAERAAQLDLRDVVLRTMRDISPDLTLDYLRLALRTKPFVAIRRAIIIDALHARHRVRDIARFLNISDSAVSRVASTLYPRPPVRFDK